MKVFLDANVLFSAAYRPRNGLLRLWTLPNVTLWSSTQAVAEAQRNLDEAAQRERLAELVAKLRLVQSIADPELPPGVSIRAKDVHIVRDAHHAKVDFLVTGDLRDFGSFFGKQIAGMTVLTPSAFLAHVDERE